MLKPGQKIVLSAVLGLLVASPASAQSLCTTFFVQDLLKGKPTIEISPGFQTILQLYDVAEWGGSARADLLNKPELIGGNRIVLTTPASSGASDFALLVRGQLIMFDLVIRPGSTGRCYSVEWQPSRPASTASSNLPRSNSNTPITRPTPQTQAPQAATPPREPVAPQAAVPTTTTPAVPAAPVAAAPAPAPMPAPMLATAAPAPRTEGELPAWLSFNLITVPSTLGDGKVTLFYTVENRGSNRVIMDSAGIVVTHNGKPIEHSLMRLPQQFINPGTSQSGQIVLGNVVPGEISLQWPVVEVIADSANGTTFVLKRTVNGQQTVEIQGR